MCTHCSEINVYCFLPGCTHTFLDLACAPPLSGHSVTIQTFQAGLSDGRTVQSVHHRWPCARPPLPHMELLGPHLNHALLHSHSVLLMSSLYS